MAYTRHLPLLLCFSNSNYQYTRFTPFFRVCPHARTRPRLVTRNIVILFQQYFPRLVFIVSPLCH